MRESKCVNCWRINYWEKKAQKQKNRKNQEAERQEKAENPSEITTPMKCPDEIAFWENTPVR
jgi:hypothetical protein